MSSIVLSMPSVEDLRSILRIRSGLPAAELLAALKVGRNRLSTLVAEAGDDLFRGGRARATRYALYRAIAGVGRDAPLYQVAEDGIPREAGRLSFLRNDTYWLTFGAVDAFQPGLPAFLADCVPQGFLGRNFAARHPELDLPPRLDSWSADDRLRALARRGEDTVGNVILGGESLERFLRFDPISVEIGAYPALARGALLEPRGSSAGGERPKFGAYAEGRHVLVKFAPPGDAPETRRWRDLLWCEHRALQVVAEAGLESATSRCLDVAGWRFLETVRFDRVGARGRVGVRSLAALCEDADVPLAPTWTAASVRMVAARRLISPEDARRLRWLDAFGRLIGNDDRHAWNVSFTLDPSGRARLAPAYDMLPMVFAPIAEDVPDRAFEASPPRPEEMTEWSAAASSATRYWRTLAEEPSLDHSLREKARDAAESVQRLAARLPTTSGPAARSARR